jgi:hypothetical protein
MRTGSIANFIGHFDFLSVLLVGPIVFGNSVDVDEFFLQFILYATSKLSQFMRKGSNDIKITKLK